MAKANPPRERLNMVTKCEGAPTYRRAQSADMVDHPAADLVAWVAPERVICARSRALLGGHSCVGRRRGRSLCPGLVWSWLAARGWLPVVFGEGARP
jgi:hypothetical protein